MFCLIALSLRCVIVYIFCCDCDRCGRAYWMTVFDKHTAPHVERFSKKRIKIPSYGHYSSIRARVCFFVSISHAYQLALALAWSMSDVPASIKPRTAWLGLACARAFPRPATAKIHSRPTVTLNILCYLSVYKQDNKNNTWTEFSLVLF